MKKIDATDVLSLVTTAITAVGLLLSAKIDKMNRDRTKAEIMEEIKQDLK